jgi:hypothetical protein
MDLLYPDLDATTFTSPEGYYTISFNGVPTATTYSIQAVPAGAQTSETGCNADPDKPPCCGTYQLTHLGEKSVSADATLSADRCW